MVRHHNQPILQAGGNLYLISFLIKMPITIPHKFKLRSYQEPLIRGMDNGIKRAIIVWHRRAGKDKTCFNYMITRAMQRVGTYFYLLPESTQAKKVIWDNIDTEGFR